MRATRHGYWYSHSEIDKTQSLVGPETENSISRWRYFSILDLQDCRRRNIDLISPPSGNEKQRECKTISGETQIPREEFHYDAHSNSYECPQGHRLTYQYREMKKRSGDRSFTKQPINVKASLCQECPLASRCLQGKGPRRIKRIEVNT